jgi:eukaryotic-like serine/threonine-protein kinase
MERIGRRVAAFVALGLSAFALSSVDAQEESSMHCPEGMVPIPAGVFRMGSSDGDADERPVHEVSIASFCIDTTEVTVAAYEACVTASICSRPQTDDIAHTFRPERRDDPGRAHRPINGVSWEDARTYCEWKGSRLPTEAEWEYAARGTDGRTFPWGNEPDETIGGRQCRPLPCFRNNLSPGGSIPRAASPFGAHDMAGSLWEWVADWYGPYDVSRRQDPQGPSSGTHRVLRGGAASAVDDLRSANRSHGPPTSRSISIGLRCARSVADQ